MSDTKGPSDARRVAELEEALRNVLDITTGFTKPMDDEEKLQTIEHVAQKALYAA